MEDPYSQNLDTLESNRQKPRESIFFAASLLFSRTGEEVSARVRNISSGGMMVDCSVKSNIGDEVVADIKNIGKVTGRVAWSVLPRMGIAFDREIDPTKARLKV